MSLLTRAWQLLRTSWKRDVVSRPDRYQAYVSFPVDRDHAHVGIVADHVADLERVFEGWVDVYAKQSTFAVVSDPVPADRFDPATFRTLLDQIEESFAETYSFTTLEKWRTIDGSLVKSFVVVPVKPLFPPRSPESRRQVPSAAE